MDRDIYWLARHEGWHAAIARGVASGDAQCIDVAAKLFDLYLPDGAVVVPMPSHNGHAEQMLQVAERMNSRRVWDVLIARPHESSRSQKADGLSPSPVEMWLDDGEWWVSKGINICIIDNTVATGVTATAALSAFRREGFNAKVISITKA